MKEEIWSILSRVDVGRVLRDEPMARHTTWRIGGPADVLVLPEEQDQIRRLMALVGERGWPWLVIGKGSNLLVRDGGIRGVVVKLADNWSAMERKETTVVAQSGRLIVSAANHAIRWGLSGLEFATGIPGSVGGAVRMNAGAHGGEIRDVLEWADLVFPDGSLIRKSNEELGFGYRTSRVAEWGALVVRAAFGLAPGDTAAMVSRVKAWTERRRQTQPLAQASAGSVFRNPVNHYAARLIEEAGLKGRRVGGAQISPVHANFIVNLGGATAGDVLALIHLAQEEVYRKFAVRLTPEVRIVGEDVETGG
ncbi:MAG: UDP-N-acetylmuramate dehydrogenase [Kyrpidia tusciae]|nr:UDP-N-acetylmuramate dehydrogenase [Kyrpidia tusciae]MBE3551355.1 UDP-N-acetylmuramate dehydrogenase [Kyrpidia tusciae]